MRTKKGNRTAWFRVQIVEQSEGQIVMFFDKPHDDLSPINFNASDGRSGPKAHEKLRLILDKEE
jgi:hypothetical protein